MRRASSTALLGVWYAIALHFIWVVTLLIGSKPRNVTALHGLTTIAPRPWAMLLLFAVATSAVVALTCARTPTWRVALLIPQQVVLGVSAASALYAMLVGRFADGVPRAHTFIIADQAPSLIAFAVHTATILYLAAARWRS